MGGNIITKYNVVIKSNETKVISFDETLSYYKQGWAIVMSVLASTPEEAINAYEHSFTEPDEIEINYNGYDLAEMDIEISPSNVSSTSIKNNSTSYYDSKVITTSVLGVGSSIAVTEFGLFDSEDITSQIADFDDGVNPTSGLPMMDGLDVEGNPYGVSTSLITTFDDGINPASGLSMMGGLDVGGNLYGTNSIDISTDITTDSMFVSDPSFDTFSSGGVDTFDNLF